MRDPYIHEKFTRERGAARKLAQEYFERYPKDRYQTEIETWRALAVCEYRVHDEAVEGADRLGIGMAAAERD